MKPSYSKTETKSRPDEYGDAQPESKTNESQLTGPRYTKLNQSNIDSFRSQLAIKQNGQWHQPSITDSVFLESASTLVHTSGPSHMIPRGQRFGHYRDANSHSFNPKSTLSNVGVTFSNNHEKRDLYNNRVNKHVAENSKNHPAANSYMQQSAFECSKANVFCSGKQQGRSFLREWDKYKSMYIPEFHQHKIKHYEPCVQKHSVGPGKYHYLQDIGKDRPQYSLRKRTALLQDDPTPGSNSYQVNNTLTQLNMTADVTLKKSNRIDLAKPLNDNPGPGNYQLPSLFEKSSHIRPSALKKWVP